MNNFLQWLDKIVALEVDIEILLSKIYSVNVSKTITVKDNAILLPNALLKELSFELELAKRKKQELELLYTNIDEATLTKAYEIIILKAEDALDMRKLWYLNKLMNKLNKEGEKRR